MNTSTTINQSLEDFENVTQPANATEYIEQNAILKTAFNVSVIAVQVFIMLSMGVIISIQEIKDHLKRPIGVGIALLSQFVLMPASAYGIILLMQLSNAHSLSAIILACCPGGSSSNLFAYICDGDVSLSIMLTTISTVLALGMMPFNLWIYSRNWTDDSSLKIPYKGIALTLAWILIPLTVGFLIKKYIPKLVTFISRTGSILGMSFIVAAIIIQYFMYPDAFQKGTSLWLISAFIPTAGFFIGLILSCLLRQKSQQQRTIAIETGMQSISLATALVVSSFPPQLHGEMTPLLTMCGIFLNVGGFILALIIYFYKLIRKRKLAITKVEPSKQVISTIT